MLQPTFRGGARPVAEAFGAHGLRIDQPEQIAPTLKRALALQGPVVIDIPVDYRDNHQLMIGGPAAPGGWLTCDILQYAAACEG